MVYHLHLSKESSNSWTDDVTTGPWAQSATPPIQEQDTKTGNVSSWLFVCLFVVVCFLGSFYMSLCSCSVSLLPLYVLQVTPRHCRWCEPGCLVHPGGDEKRSGGLKLPATADPHRRSPAHIQYCTKPYITPEKTLEEA